MSHGGFGVPAGIKSVAVAVNISSGSGKGSGSRRAVAWAVENFKPLTDRFVLVHVIPKIASIPTPSGDCIPVDELDANVVAMYVEEVKRKLTEVFIPFKKLCKTREMETLVLEDDDPASALKEYISESGINCLVLGSCSSNFLSRKSKGLDIPTSLLRCSVNTCEVYVVSKNRIMTKPAHPSSARESSSAQESSKQRDHKEAFRGIDEQISGLRSFPVGSQVYETIGTSSVSDLSYLNTESFSQFGSPSSFSIMECNSMASLSTEKSDAHAEVERLRQELQNTIGMYKRACEELVHTQNKVQLVSSVCLEEARKVNAALEREETLRKIAAEEKVKHLDAMKEVEEARDLLAKEAYERHIAEVNALEESAEKRKLVDALFSNDRRYRRYTRKEIEVATNSFSETNVIGEGGYGKVYNCLLDHTPAAVKVLQSGAANKREEFLKEVEVLSKLHHPNIVLLLGACPESGCLVYEYMENGSLEDHIFSRSEKPPLPWFIRFRIACEIACGLAFLHNSKPDPIVHRDLKPGNILLDRNYVSKIGDVGLAKLISDVVPDNITEYKDSILAGTLFYMDPEYQRTGTIRPKSDLYALGIIILQLVTARQPKGLLLTVENAVGRGSVVDVLDKSIEDWPLVETEELVRLALMCSKLRCRDRPDLDTEVLPVLKRLFDIANACEKLERINIQAPSHYYCPILQDIMEDPYLAADGFTYEYIAIKAWLEKHNVSPVTKLKLQHSTLTPNHTLRSAIHDWRSWATFSSV
ncbi:hypothetical protein UlMin_022028 [Ulmus minor]